MVCLLKYSQESFFGRNLASTKSMEAENTMWFSVSWGDNEKQGRDKSISKAFSESETRLNRPKKATALGSPFSFNSEVKKKSSWKLHRAVINSAE